MKNRRLKTWIWVVLLAIPCGLGLWYFDSRQGYKKCKNIEVMLTGGDAEKAYLRPKDIKRVITKNGKRKIEGTRFENINMQVLEEEIKENTLVKNCEIARSLNGNLLVNIEQHQPIARIVGQSSDRFTDKYLTAEGTVIALSPYFTSRVMLLRNDRLKNLQKLETTHDKNLLSLLNKIHSEPFWKAQIAEIEWLDDSEVVIIPQMGNFKIEFGTPNAVDDEMKLQKIKIAYTHIMPTRGWNEYKRLSVKFKNQIVCE